MDLIVTHLRTDFDAFASMLIAGRLFPGAIPVLPSTTIYKLREVLSLYRDVADFKNIRYLNKLKKPSIDQVIVVDTKKRGMLKRNKLLTLAIQRQITQGKATSELSLSLSHDRRLLRRSREATGELFQNAEI